MDKHKNHFTLLEYDPLKLLNKYDKICSIMEVRDGKKIFDPLWPISVELHLTDLCNLNCRWCTDAGLKKNQASLEFDVVKSLFDEFKKHSVGVTLEGGGEPTIHKNFYDIVQYGASIDLDMGLITNGVKEIRDIINLLRWVRISLDASNANEYKYEKGVNLFDKVIDNIKQINIGRDRDKVFLGIGYVITKDNDKDLLLFINMMNEMGVDYIYMRPVEENKELSPDYISLDAYKKIIEKKEDRLSTKVLLKVNERTIRDNDNLPCIAHSLTCVIRANGDLVLCEKRKHDIVVLGNVNKTSFENIWMSEKRKNISKKLLNNSSTKGCEVCRLTRFNKIFYELGGLRTSNFI